MSFLKSVHSGAQTGVDTAGLIAADLLGFKTGGWACQGWLDENGANEAWMRLMGLRECANPGWAARTEANVRDTDATIILSHEQKLTGGSYQTMCLCESLNKPLYQIWFDRNSNWNAVRIAGGLRLRTWLNLYEVQTLNVAGPRESKCRGIGDYACLWLMEQLSVL